MTSGIRYQVLATEGIHLFEGERLTQEQNEASILDPPELDKTIKFNHTITPPLNVADIITRVYPKDVLVTVLSRNRTFMGSDSAGFTLSDPLELNVSIELHYGNLACSWMKDFDFQGLGLKDIDATMIHLSDQQIEKKLAVALVEYNQSGMNVDTEEGIEKFAAFVGVYNSRSNPTVSMPFQGDRYSVIKMNNVVDYLAQYSKQQSAEMFQNLIAYTNASQSAFTSSALIQTIEKLVDVAHTSLSDLLGDRIAALARFLIRIDTPHHLLSRIHSKTLDDFAHDLAVCGNGALARTVLGIMIEKQRVYPSAETMDVFWSVYAQSFAGKSRLEAVRSMSALKPVIFHHGASANLIEVLLHYIVGSSQELERCLYFVERSQNASLLLAQFQTRFAEKLLDLHRTNERSPIEHALERTQLARALAVRNKITLSEGTKDLLQHGA